MEPPSPELLTTLLKEVSRSFYLTMRVLPACLRRPISVAYLLARASDTLADTEILPASSRLKALGEFAERVSGRRTEPVQFPEFIANQGIVAEARLLRRSEEAAALLDDIYEEDQRLIRKVLRVIISGQELDLRRFEGAGVKNVIALETEADLDDYTYRVAGVVGEFWTKLCQASLFRRAPQEEWDLIQKGVHFGQGLQMVNILRDLPKDLRQGRCYIPTELLRAAGLAPADLLDPAAEQAFRPVFHHLCARAQGFLAEAWDYTNALPRNQIRVRLACAWPVLIGAETLEALRFGNVLDPSRRIKISRPRVRHLMLRSVLFLPFNGRWKNQFRRA
jgi:farnesyl-diphosphate farnesyltransferase